MLSEREVEAIIIREKGGIPYSPVYPKGRKDVCAVKCMVDESDVLFLVIKYENGVSVTEMASAPAIFVEKVEIDKLGNVIIKDKYGNIYQERFYLPDDFGK